MGSRNQRKKDNYEALKALFEEIDKVLSKTESFVHVLDFGSKKAGEMKENETAREIHNTCINFNNVYIRNRNKLAEKLTALIDRIE